MSYEESYSVDKGNMSFKSFIMEFGEVEKVEPKSLPDFINDDMQGDTNELCVNGNRYELPTGRIESRRIIMRKIPLNRKILIIILVSIVAVTISISFRLLKKVVNDDYNKPDYSVYFVTRRSSKTGKDMFVPALEDGPSEKIAELNNVLDEVFVDWLPEKFKYPEASALRICLSTDKYLSAYITYTFSGRRISNQIICNTIDVESGQAIYLDDLIEVDEELASMILTEGIPMMKYDWLTEKFDALYRQESLERHTREEILEKLKVCSEPFDENNWNFKPTFYLAENRLYLLNIFNIESKLYIELEKLRGKLKVDTW